MRINHNIAALNASNRLKTNDNAISKNLQKLSSGYRINSAADDAAGLAVSEKMRAQINGLNQAEDNAQNGISLVQTAEGGLNETESILQRMNTLAVQSANGTYQNETDRANLNKEVEALKKEVDRISTSTNFNGINLLDGSLGYDTTNTLASTAITLSGGNLEASDELTVATTDAGVLSVTSSESDVTFDTVTVASDGSYTLTAKVADSASDEVKAKYSGLSITVNTSGYDTSTAGSGTVTVNSNNSLSLQIGSENKADQRVSLAVADMSSKGLGIDQISVATPDDAKAAIDTIKAAIATVSGTRADLGALQNRLEHTTNNLSTMSENLTSAESTIRDVDMSSEMVDLTKNQILEQAATSMLAQANSQPQSVLSLLKG
ncbi:A-type flagellin [Caprobacter fermentans]|uniref:Flagellin n=1 Tax=Caproicibacter fermentans TaxID=2576756 RepID=A0A6N8HVH2_9FIRM|nr:flagellin [Caproicibacter fermentans]MVB09722.1 A-type flagellin [Caproicibacter fermentans]QNK42392.1 flagellin [Caproicibacter fermentans]